MQALRKISVTQRPSWSNKLVESQSCSTSASRFCVSSWQSRSNNGFLKHKMKLAISEGVKPLWTRDRETDVSSTRIFSHSGVWMSLKLPCPTAMSSNYRNSWHSECNSLELIKSSGRSPVLCSSLSQSASNSALCLSRISAQLGWICTSDSLRDSFARAYFSVFWWGNFWV